MRKSVGVGDLGQVSVFSGSRFTLESLGGKVQTRQAKKWRFNVAHGVLFTHLPNVEGTIACQTRFGGAFGGGEGAEEDPCHLL